MSGFPKQCSVELINAISGELINCNHKLIDLLLRTPVYTNYTLAKCLPRCKMCFVLKGQSLNTSTSSSHQVFGCLHSVAMVLISTVLLRILHHGRMGSSSVNTMLTWDAVIPGSIQLSGPIHYIFFFLDRQCSVSTIPKMTVYVVLYVGKLKLKIPC